MSITIECTKCSQSKLNCKKLAYWCYIVEFEQNGEDRAKYGTRLLEEMAKEIKVKGMKGLNSRALRSCRLFYVSYPRIWRSVTAKLKQLDYNSLHIATKEIMNWRLVTAEFIISTIVDG